MSWIRQIPVQSATGLLKREFDKAWERAGRIWNIVHVMSVNPPVMRDGLFNYYTRIADGLGVEEETFIRPWGDPRQRVGRSSEHKPEAAFVTNIGGLCQLMHAPNNRTSEVNAEQHRGGL